MDTCEQLAAEREKEKEMGMLPSLTMDDQKEEVKGDMIP